MTEEDREHYEYEGSIDKIAVYTIIDSAIQWRGSHDRVLNDYDFTTAAGVVECLRDLEAGEIEMSRRNSVPVLQLAGR